MIGGDDRVPFLFSFVLKLFNGILVDVRLVHAVALSGFEGASVG